MNTRCIFARNMCVLFCIVFLPAIYGGCAGVSADAQKVTVRDGTTLVIDSSAALLYIDLLRYIRTAHIDELDLPEGALSADQIKSRVAANRKDPELTARINKLLSHPVYSKLAPNMRSFAVPAWGRQAYRETFYRLPWERTLLRGGVDEQIMSTILQLDDHKVETINALLTDIATASSAQRVFDTTDQWLPDGLEHRESYTVSVYFDGNRGSFAEQGAIFLDLAYDVATLEEPESLARVENVISHELHHIAYEEWLRETAFWFVYPPTLDVRKAELTHWRMRIIMEGTAQFCDMGDKPAIIQDMFFDPELSYTIFGIWEDTFMAMIGGEMAIGDYNQLIESHYHEAAQNLLVGYLQNFYTDEEIAGLMDEGYAQYRPVIEYYIGYRVFREIYNRGGAAAYQDAISNPRTLLGAYSSTSANSTAPQISDELVEAWTGL